MIVLHSTNVILYEWWRKVTGQTDKEAATGWKKKALEGVGVSFEIRPGLIFAIYVRVRGVGLTVVTTQILMSRVIRIFFA